MGETLGLPKGDLDHGLRRARRARTARRVGLLVFAAICVAALAGLFGPMETTEQVSSEQGELEVTFPRVVRPGGEIELTVLAEASGAGDGFSLVVDQALFEELGVERIWPEPASQTAEHEKVVLAFDSGPDEATVKFSGRLPRRPSPSVQTVAIALADDADQAADGVDMKVWVLP